MPYKASLKTGEPRKRKEPDYRVTNAHAYNQSLKKREQLSLYCPRGDLKALFINETPYVPGVPGRAPSYTRAYVELIYTFYRLFGWVMRQISGFMQDYWAMARSGHPGAQLRPSERSVCGAGVHRQATLRAARRSPGQR